MSDLPKKPKFSRRVKILFWTAAIVLAYTVFGFFVIPAVIKSQMIKRLPALTQRHAAVREVAFNPFTFDLGVRGVALTETNGDAFAGFEEFHAQFQAMSSISHRAWVFKDVTLTRPFAHVIRRKDGTFNFDNLMGTNAATPAPPPATPSALPSVLVESFRVTNASLEADDLVPAAAFHDKLAPVNLEVTNFATMTNASSAFVFSATTDSNETFATSGQLTVQPLHVSGRVKVAGLDLARYAPYLAAFTTAQLAGGKLDVGADYQLAIGAKGLDATVTNATAQLSDLRVKSPDTGETVVTIPSLAVMLTEASLAKASARVASVESSGGSLWVRRNGDGTINLLRLLVNTPPPAATAPAPVSASAPAAGPPWTAQVDKIEFTNYSVTVEDKTTPHPAKLEVGGLAFSVEGFNTATLPPVSTRVAMRLNGTGTLSVSGKVGLSPMSADLTVDLTALELPAFQPYLAGSVNVNLLKGRMDVHGKVHGVVAATGPAGGFDGDVALKDFATSDALRDRDLVKFDTLAVTGIQAAFPPPKLQIRELALAGFHATLSVDTNGQVNLASVLPAKPAATKTTPALAPAQAASAQEIPVDLAALVLDKASFHFVDKSITPNCDFSVQDLGGSIKDLSNHEQKPATVDMHGSVDQFSPFSITGTLEPLSKDLSLNLAVNVKNFELTGFDPYMEKYGGHPLDKGKLMLDLKYEISEHKLIAGNKVTIADLTLGPKNNSTNAVHAPIKLGVALLKDRKGNIDLDIPLSGRTDDPKFRLVPLIWQVVDNLLLKAAASPFTFLGKALGGSGPPPDSVTFVPGSAVLEAAQKALLQNMVKALYARPGLTLQIAGACDPAADGAVLAKEHLRRRINKMRADELAAAGQPVPSVDSINLDPADYSRLLQALYTQKFGTNAPAVETSNAPVAVAAAPAPPAAPPAPTKKWGAGTFVRGGGVMEHHDAAVQSPPAAQAPPPVAAAPTPAAVPAAPDVADVPMMEEKMIAEIKVTDDELRDLMQARAKSVQSALTESGQVAADRLFILAPKPVDRSAKGQTRAVFSVPED